MIHEEAMKHQSSHLKIVSMVCCIVRQFHPERIILFGSHANGHPSPDSDVDLLVVMPVKGSKRRKVAEIRLALQKFRIPKDILLNKPEEFAWRKDTVGTIEWPAEHHGEVLYARAG
jgi:predicted nucleotidyltransferase